MRKRQTERDTMQVDDVIRKFEEAENSLAHRKGTFKIDAPFERALEKIVKTKPRRDRDEGRASHRNNRKVD